MKKCYIENLAFNVTDNCNLNCAHCLRGKKINNYISDEVIEKALDQVACIGNIAINGGEPTLAISKIEKIISYIIDNSIQVDEFTMTINGTIYSEELLKLLDEIDNYIGSDNLQALFAISLDDYHIDEINRLNLTEQFIENIKKYKENKHFYGFRGINKKLFREGNAKNLDSKKTVPLRPMKTYITYVGKKSKYDRENGLCNIGPLVTIGTTGIITECDASITNQSLLYNYGNILYNSIEDIVLQNGELITNPKKFEKLANKEMKRYRTYNK